MTAGLPGSGIGGLFYLVASLAIPVRELWLVARGDTDRVRMRLAWRQFAVAVGLLAAIWMSGALARLLIAVSVGDASAAPTGLAGTTGAVALLAAAGVLSAVVLLVEVLALTARRRRRAATTPAGRLGLTASAKATANPPKRFARRRTTPGLGDAGSIRPERLAGHATCPAEHDRGLSAET